MELGGATGMRMGRCQIPVGLLMAGLVLTWIEIIAQTVWLGARTETDAAFDLAVNFIRAELLLAVLSISFSAAAVAGRRAFDAKRQSDRRDRLCLLGVAACSTLVSLWAYFFTALHFLFKQPSATTNRPTDSVNSIKGQFWLLFNPVNLGLYALFAASFWLLHSRRRKIAATWQDVPDPVDDPMLLES